MSQLPPSPINPFLIFNFQTAVSKPDKLIKLHLEANYVKQNLDRHIFFFIFKSSMSGIIVISTLFDNQVLSCELKNPRKKNALSLNMIEEIIALLSKKKLDQDYKCIVFKGFKDKTFCAGADLNEVLSFKKNNKLNVYHSKLNKLLKILRKKNILKLSIISEHCIGAGFILAMNTDICIVKEGSNFSIPASKLNIKLPKYQINQLINKFPGNLLLKEAIITGRSFSSKEAYNFNLINLVLKKNNFKKNYLNYLSNLIKLEKQMRDYYNKSMLVKVKK